MFCLGAVPWVVWGFFKIITPFIDPVTRDKLKFNEDMTQYVAPAQLWSADWGGQLDFEYEHGVYWPALNEMCRKRREERTRRWVAGGKVAGESEAYLTGGTDVSVEGVTYDASAAAAAVEGKGDGIQRVEEKMAAATLEQSKAEPVKVAA